MRNLLAIIFWLTFLSVYSQENIDSLISSWNKMSTDFLKVNEIDSACKYGNCVIDIMDQKVELNNFSISDAQRKNLKKQKAAAYGNLVTAYGNSNQIKRAMNSYDSALQIYYEINDPDEIFQLHIRMGRVNDLRSNYSEAIPYYQKARDQAKINKDKKGMSLAYYFMGLNYRYLGNYSEAIKNHYEDLKIQEELNNKVGIANAYVTIAAILNKLKDSDAAFEKLMEAKRLYEEMKDSTGIAMIYNDLGTTYYKMGDTLRALESHLQAAELRRLVDEFDGLGASNSYIARIYQDMGDFQQAHNHLHLAENAFHNSSNLQGIMTTQIDMARLHFKKKEMDSAIVWLNIAQSTATKIMNYQGLILIHSIRGEIELFQKKYQQSISDFQRGLAIAEDLRDFKQLYQLNVCLAETYMEIEDFKNAFFYQNKSIQYRDTLDNNANYTAAVEMEMQYNYKKEKIKEQLLQEKKDALNEAKLTKQKTKGQLYFAGILMFLMISIGLWSRLRYIRKAGRELLSRKEEAEYQRLMAESERERATNSEKVKEQFLTNMSHEIRTPMNAIMGMTDIIIRNDHPSSQDIYLNAIRQSSENLLVILNEILDLSKLEAGKIELEQIQFSPEKVVRNVKDILRFKAEEKGLHLNVHIDEKVPEYLIGDPTRLNQIIVNLVSNAIKFTEKGKVRIEVLTKEISEENAILQFKVIDTGIGIAEDKMNTIFEVFTQEDTDTTRKYGGTGLGLSICKKLVDLHKGKIKLESIKDSGSTFIVEIPYTICDLCKDDQQEDFSVTLKDLNILLVEDNAFNLLLRKTNWRTVSRG